MIRAYTWPTPNGHKVHIMLYECDLEHEIIPIDIAKGDQFDPAFLKISPNHRMPAIVDHDVAGEPVSVFESGAILLYLAEKTGKFMASDPLGRKETLEWLFWQVGNLGPMAGQYSHFRNYAPEDEQQSYARQRYTDEYYRCLTVLENRLREREYIVGDTYSIADMISWPWVLIVKAVDLSLEDFPNVARWRNAIKQRPAVQRGVELGKEYRRKAAPDDEERKILFNQTGP